MDWMVMLLSAAAGAVTLWRSQTPVSRLSDPRTLPDSYVPLVFGGAFQWGRSSRNVLDRICVSDQGLAVIGAEQTLEFAFTDLYALSHETAGEAVQLTLYLERQSAWGVLTVIVSPADALSLLRVIRRARPEGVPLAAADVGIYAAQLADQTLHGSLTTGAEVALYVLGRSLVVVQGETVLAQVSIGGIRRVIATQISANKGLVRLYSATETTLFVCLNYSALACHLADHAGCPLDMVTVSDRKTK